MMKTIPFLLPLILCSFLVFGCGISGDEDRGTAPTIRAVYFYKDASTVPTSNFNVGDNITIGVHLEDPDLDIVTLHVIIYDLSNPDIVYDGPTVYELDSVQLPEYNISQKLDVTFPASGYRIDFQVADEKGNVSLPFRKKLYVL
ncbi:MAG: hypothetical protein JRE12_15710 [Deltaproteobacteria bacterium]|nr:hypothetical protein [Deltaproteobacteria bacterium]